MLTNQEKGYKYEKDIKNYIINELGKKAYLWSETPETILVEKGIIGSHNELRLKRKENQSNPLRDTGVDIIQMEENEISFIQCKNGYSKGLRMEDLAGFSLMTLHHYEKICNGYVYYTDKLSYNILSLPQIEKIKYIKKYFSDQENNNKNEVKKIIPYDYQLEVKNKLIAHYKNKTRGILSLPCGVGKTLISYITSIEISKQIIIISPLKQFAKQNLERFVEYGFDGSTLLVDSDGTIDFEKILHFIKSNEKFVISLTFCSVDMIRKCMEKLSNPFIIVDEFHNLSKSNVSEYLENTDNSSESNESSDEENEEMKENPDDFYQILKSENKILFVSATPRIYELESEGEAYNENIFGEIIYKMSFNYAIENKLICDYTIWLPSIHEDNTQLKKELEKYQIDNVIKAKCMYLYSCILNTGSMKTIIYCMDTNEIKLMSEGIKLLDEYYVLGCDINEITSNTTHKNRTKILNEFATKSSIQLLFSVRILDECVDIPSCDSIFITYPTKSKIRTIQRMSRATRLNPLNKYKKANVF
jgi:superfamily II DNA or RNA helicase